MEIPKTLMLLWQPKRFSGCHRQLNEMKATRGVGVCLAAFADAIGLIDTNEFRRDAHRLGERTRIP